MKDYIQFILGVLLVYRVYLACIWQFKIIQFQIFKIKVQVKVNKNIIGKSKLEYYR